MHPGRSTAADSPRSRADLNPISTAAGMPERRAIDVRRRAANYDALLADLADALHRKLEAQSKEAAA